MTFMMFMLLWKNVITFLQLGLWWPNSDIRIGEDTITKRSHTFGIDKRAMIIKSLKCHLEQSPIKLRITWRLMMISWRSDHITLIKSANVFLTTVIFTKFGLQAPQKNQEIFERFSWCHDVRFAWLWKSVIIPIQQELSPNSDARIGKRNQSSSNLEDNDDVMKVRKRDFDKTLTSHQQGLWSPKEILKEINTLSMLRNELYFANKKVHNAKGIFGLKTHSVQFFEYSVTNLCFLSLSCFIYIRNISSIFVVYFTTNF